MVADSHESIISRELFDAVQKEFEKRQNQYGCHETRHTYALTGKIVCGVCGNNYKRKKRRDHFTWLCTTYNSKGKSACDSKQVPEDVILKFTYIYYSDRKSVV